MSLFDDMQEIKTLSDAILKPENKILKGRVMLNLTQAELAPLLGVSLKTIKNWEQGTRKPSKSALMLLELELKK